MSFESIGRLQRRDTDTIRAHYAKGKNIVLNGMRDFVGELPRVTTTLEIATI